MMVRIIHVLILGCVFGVARSGFLFNRDESSTPTNSIPAGTNAAGTNAAGTNAAGVNAASTMPVGTNPSGGNTAGVNPASTTSPLTTAAVGDPNCTDKVNCLNYGHASCTGPYEAWANQNCRAFCGFCIPITTPFICEDKIDNCNQYGDALCTLESYISFVEENCLKYCKMCPEDLTTPIPKTGCVDDFERCDEFGKGTCTNFPSWSKQYCASYCDFCESNETETTTTPEPTTVATTHSGDPCYDRQDCSGYDIHTSCCGTYEAYSKYNCAKHCRFCTPIVPDKRLCTDTIPNCNQYGDDLCTNKQYVGFVETKCAGYCNLCNKTLFVPECARSKATSGAGLSTTPVPEKKCSSGDEEYSKGSTWYTEGCVQQCECLDPDSNQIKCGPLECPRERPDCTLVYVVGGCCPVLKCSFLNTIHGEMTQEWNKKP